MTKNKSFTLIELLVVIVIIGILAGVIVISTSSSIDKANFAKAQAFSNTVQNELLLNLVSEWTFDDPSNIGEDSWGTNNCTLVVPAGTNNPQIKTENCISNSCLFFNNSGLPSGSGSYLDCGSLSTLLNIWTIELWVKTLNNGLMSFSLGNVMIYLNSGIAWPGNAWYPTVGNVCDDKWHHLVFTYSETNQINGNNIFAYVDGKLTAEGNKNWSSVQGPIYIGRGHSWSNSYPYRGMIDEIRVYNNYFSISQIKQNYIAGLNSMLSNGNISKQEYNERISNLAYDE